MQRVQLAAATQLYEPVGKARWKSCYDEYSRYSSRLPAFRSCTTGSTLRPRSTAVLATSRTASTGCSHLRPVPIDVTGAVAGSRHHRRGTTAKTVKTDGTGYTIQHAAGARGQNRLKHLSRLYHMALRGKVLCSVGFVVSG